MRGLIDAFESNRIHNYYDVIQHSTLDYQ
jgi:hypothetical protein